MGYKVVAQGTNIWNLRETIGDIELKKGDRMRVVMDLKFPFVEYAFDAAGAEFIFSRFVPEGMDLIDVWGENGQGIVELEADPVWFLAALAFIKAHWLAIAIAGLLLTAAIASIIILVKIARAEVPGGTIPILAIAGIGAATLLMILLLRKGGSP